VTDHPRRQALDDSYISLMRSDAARSHFNEPVPDAIDYVQTKTGRCVRAWRAISDLEIEAVQSDPVGFDFLVTKEQTQEVALRAFCQVRDQWNELHPKPLPAFRFGPLRLGQPDVVDGME
jgi:hypothetical protein